MDDPGVDPEQCGIESIIEYSTDRVVIERVRNVVRESLQHKPGPVMVTLDSGLSEDNVTRELELYSLLVTQNSYLVVEDRKVNGHPAALDHIAPRFHPTRRVRLY